MRPWLEVVLFSALAVLFLMPQSLSPATRIGYVGDSLESVAIVGFLDRQIVTNPAHLFDAGFLHPQRNALTLTDHRLLPALVVAPVYWLSGNPVLAYNAALLFVYLVAAFGARALAGVLGFARTESNFVGALFAFHTYAINEAPRLNIVSHGFAAFALAFLVRWMRDGATGDAWRYALYMLLQGYSANYHLLYAVFLSVLVLVIFGIGGTRQAPLRVRGLVAPGVIAALLFAPVLVSYLRTFAELDLVRTRPRGIDLLHFFSTSPSNVVWGAIGPPARLQQQGPHFVGFLALGLAAAGLILSVRKRADGPRWPIAVAALTAVLVTLALGDRFVVRGHDFGPGPYGLLYDFVPGFRLVRIPERLGLYVMLGVGLLGAIPLKALGRTRPLAAMTLACAAVLEHFSPLRVTTDVPRPAEIPPVYAWLREQPREPIVELPIRGEGLVRQETIDMFFATFHRNRQALGYTAYPTLLSKAIRRSLLDFPSDASLAALDRIGVHRFVFHRGREIAPDLRDQIFNFGPPDKERRFAEAVSAAGLDIEKRVDEGLASGVLVSETSFPSWRTSEWSSGGDVVLRARDVPRVIAAPLASGTPVGVARIRLRTKEGDASLAFDGDLDTSYAVSRPLRGDELIEATWDSPSRLSGVELILRHESAWPTRFRIAVKREDNWTEVARFDGPHTVQLIDGLLRDPRVGRLSFSLDGSEVMGVQILPEIGGTSVAGWNLPELRLLERPMPAPTLAKP